MSVPNTIKTLHLQQMYGQPEFCNVEL